jgi:hypothetical protein
MNSTLSPVIQSFRPDQPAARVWFPLCWHAKSVTGGSFHCHVLTPEVGSRNPNTICKNQINEINEGNETNGIGFCVGFCLPNN